MQSRKVKYLTTVAKPAVGSVGRTGIWRILRPVIDYDKCIKCLNCWLYCPEGAISDEEGTPVIDYEYCKGCGICANECPAGAISMVREG